jgi:hypothetical protein
MLLPAQFLRIAEPAIRILQIGRQVLRQRRRLVLRQVQVEHRLVERPRDFRTLGTP